MKLEPFGKDHPLTVVFAARILMKKILAQKLILNILKHVHLVVFMVTTRKTVSKNHIHLNQLSITSVTQLSLCFHLNKIQIKIQNKKDGPLEGLSTSAEEEPESDVEFSSAPPSPRQSTDIDIDAIAPIFSLDQQEPNQGHPSSSGAGTGSSLMPTPVSTGITGTTGQETDNEKELANILNSRDPSSSEKNNNLLSSSIELNQYNSTMSIMKTVNGVAIRIFGSTYSETGARRSSRQPKPNQNPNQ
ncbi:hypothetical protein BDC45DRAFT_491565 [Circinella umbellata]|nr:hypothetical protein BDC45DRAFT_491565 [Circinella umbellata]